MGKDKKTLQLPGLNGLEILDIQKTSIEGDAVIKFNQIRPKVIVLHTATPAYIWEEHDPSIKVTEDNIVTFTTDSMLKVRANTFIPSHTVLYYFEMKILNMGTGGRIGFGIEDGEEGVNLNKFVAFSFFYFSLLFSNISLLSIKKGRLEKNMMLFLTSVMERLESKSGRNGKPFHIPP